MEPKEELKTVYGYLEELELIEKNIKSLRAEINGLKADAKEIRYKIQDLKEGKKNEENL